MSKVDSAIEPEGKNYKLTLDEYASVIIGDENSVSFKPSARYSAFGADSTGLVLRTPSNKNITPVLENGVIGWDDPENHLGVRFYEHLDKGRWERGSVEHEVILYARPPSNVIPFAIELSGLTLHYQGELTDWEKDRGNVRPEEMIGGYVAYHDTKGRINKPGDTRYKVGKAFDLPRPTATDFRGDRVWGTWKPGAVSVFDGAAFDPAWLDKATYPVVVGPTIGYTALGASNDATNDYSLANQYVAGANGDGAAGTAYYGGFDAGGASTVYVAVYENGDGNISSNARLAVSGAITLTAVAGFRSAALTYAFVSGVTYFIEGFSDTANVQMRYDATAGQTNQYTNNGVASPPDPHAARSGTQANFQPSVYVEFTEGVGSTLRRYSLPLSGVG